MAGSREQPDGELTPSQHEIMVLVWDAGEAGLSVAEIWKAIADRRGVARTTVLNLVDRLEKRGWLVRQPVAGAFRYRPAIPRDAAESRLAAGFVADFFGGSMTQLVQSLLGGSGASPDEIERMRKLLAEARSSRPSTRRPQKRRSGKE